MTFNHTLLNPERKSTCTYMVWFLTEVSVHAEVVGEDWLTRGGVPAGS